jgi:hypothetical protein
MTIAQALALADLLYRLVDTARAAGDEKLSDEQMAEIALRQAEADALYDQKIAEAKRRLGIP